MLLRSGKAEIVLRTASHLGPHVGTVVEPVGEAAKHLVQARGRDGALRHPGGLVRTFDQGTRSRGQLDAVTGRARGLSLGCSTGGSCRRAEWLPATLPASVEGTPRGLSGSTDMGFLGWSDHGAELRWGEVQLSFLAGGLRKGPGRVRQDDAVPGWFSLAAGGNAGTRGPAVEPAVAAARLRPGRTPELTNGADSHKCFLLNNLRTE